MRRLLPALLILLVPTLAVAAPPPLPPKAAVEDEGLYPEEAAGGIKKKKDAVKRPPRTPSGPSGGFDGGGGGSCISCGPVCDLGPMFGEDEAPRRPRGGGGGGGKRPRGGKRPKPKQVWVDAWANGGWTFSSMASGGAPNVEGADALLAVGARVELREGVGFDVDNFTLFASDGTLPTWGLHLSFGTVTRKLRLRLAAGVRALVIDDPDVAQLWGFETGPSLDYTFARRWRWDATVLYGQFPTVTTFLVNTGVSYGTTLAPRVGYRAFFWDGIDHGPEVGVTLRF